MRDSSVRNNQSVRQPSHVRRSALCCWMKGTSLLSSHKSSNMVLHFAICFTLAHHVTILAPLYEPRCPSMPNKVP